MHLLLFKENSADSHSAHGLPTRKKTTLHGGQSLPLRSDRGRFSRLLFFSSLSLLLFVFFGCSDGMEREACVCDHGYERSDLCAEIIIIIIIIPLVVC